MQNSTRTPAPSSDTILQHAFDIENQAGDIEILIAAIFDKIDDFSDLTPSGKEAIFAINCFATCALRNAALIKEAGANLLHLTSEGGAV